MIAALSGLQSRLGPMLEDAQNTIAEVEARVKLKGV
jgi:hypothetical protein